MCANGSAAERSAGDGDGAEADADGSLTPEETKRTSRLRPMAAAQEGPVRVPKWSWSRV